MTSVLPKEWFDEFFARQPLGRFAHVDEIAPTAVLLASDAGAYYTGVSMNMNGGDVMV
jgi:3-oxoacyl-[acyl-carrier protein] reductase